MIDSAAPTLVNNRMMSREPAGPPKRSLTLDTSSFPGFAGLQPRSFTSPNMSPTSRNHSEELPSSVSAIDAQSNEEISGFLESATQTLVLDVRPFNLYAQSHLKSSVNVCVPTTLLRRPRYDLQHVIGASSLSEKLKEAVMDSTKRMRVLLYDSDSVDSSLSFQLHHTMLKFLQHNHFDLYYLRGGLNKIDPSFLESTSPQAPNAPFPNSTASDSRSNPSEKSSPTDGVAASTESMPFLTGFSLPSATTSDNKLLMSIKKTLPKLDTVTSYNYNFHFPSNFEEKMSRLPRWLSFFADVYGKENSSRLIVEKFNDMFNRLEKTEQVRLRMAISNMDKDSELCRKLDQNLHETAGYGTPSTLCPCCDKIDYTIPQGVEYGYKNRYNNIWPYEHSRVHLIASPSCTQKKEGVDDYFNANYISYKRISDRKYIATQNPLDATKDDFWSTIWYKGVKAIICLAASPVFGQQAYYECDQFLEKSQLDIKIKHCEQTSSFTIREITITKNGETHTVYHFAYQKWPDFGTPDELNTVFDLMSTKDTKMALFDPKVPESAKTVDVWDVLVHCSAGCGRTGCYITMDMVVDSFKTPNKHDKHFDPWGDDDLVYKSIQFQRQQRISMVQNLDQFIFCYESILNYIVDNLIE